MRATGEWEGGEPEDALCAFLARYSPTTHNTSSFARDDFNGKLLATITIVPSLLVTTVFKIFWGPFLLFIV